MNNENLAAPAFQSRRSFLGGASAGVAAGMAATLFGPLLRSVIADSAPAGRAPRIVLRSSWQTVNIGDIGHTPGILKLLEQYIPEAEITLWPSSVGGGVREMLSRNFPKVRFAVTPEEVKKALPEADFLLHGSGASFVAEKHVAKWKKETGKPYGVYGITLGAVSDEGRELLTGAKFVFFRDSVSMQFAKDHGVKCPVMEFGPDGAFGVTLRNDEPAIAFLRENKLEEGKFLCLIPRLRFTPYWKIRNKPMTAEDDRKHARNEEMKAHDHAPLREAVIAVVRQTSLKVLVCPEDESQMAVGKEMIVDPLPDDIKPRVVWREKYWLTDEAMSTYTRSAGLFGSEMHSPIMCIGNGVPAIVCRFAEQTSKGLMWRDIGLGDWLFDLDDEKDVARIVPTVLAMAQDPVAAKARAAKAREFVEHRQRETMAVVKKSLPA